MRQKSDISYCRSKEWFLASPKNSFSQFSRKIAPFKPYGRSVIVRPVRGHLTTKINITFFIRNKMPNIFLFNNFFGKSSIFRENCEKLFSGHIRWFFSERRRLAPKIKRIFFTNEVWNISLLSDFFKKKLYFLRKWQKNFSGGHFWRDRGAWRQKLILLFYVKCGLNTFSFNNFYKKSNIF